MGDQRESFKSKLESYGICRKKYEYGTLLWALAIVISCLFLTWFVVEVVNKKPLDWSKAAQPIITIGIAFVAYKQWIAARHEISIDKYYDRLDVANKRLEELEGIGKVQKADMHLFTELDKLEYVIVKYELGYISPEIALRAVENFKAHCRESDFLDQARTKVKKAAYLEQTRTAVEKIF